MGKKVLGVGHCGFDSGRLATVVEEAGGSFENAATPGEALERLQGGGYALVLPNRVIGSDEEAGVKFIRRLKEDARLAAVPVMLVSGIAEAQEAARGAGAEPGFGKNELEAESARDLLRKYLH